MYYNLEVSILNVSPRDSWDIAFTTYRLSAIVLFNNSTGIILNTYPEESVEDWVAVDTTGIMRKPLLNSIEDVRI